MLFFTNSDLNYSLRVWLNSFYLLKRELDLLINCKGECYPKKRTTCQCRSSTTKDSASSGILKIYFSIAPSFIMSLSFGLTNMMKLDTFSTHTTKRWKWEISWLLSTMIRKKKMSKEWSGSNGHNFLFMTSSLYSDVSLSNHSQIQSKDNWLLLQLMRLRAIVSTILWIFCCKLMFNRSRMNI